jgi:hypothetical protein
MTFYGDAFADFLENFEPCSALPYLADLARLEAARTHAYHAPDATPLGPDAFARLSPAELMDLRVALHPSVALLASPHPVATIFAMNMGELPLAEITDWKGEDLVIARPHATVEVHLLPQGGSVFLARLSEGATLAKAAEAALAAHPDFDLTENLAHLIGSALATAIVTQPKISS